MKTKYDSDADILSIEVKGKQKIDYATEADNFVVHFTKENKPVLVEVLNASKFLKGAVRLLGPARRTFLTR